MVTVRELLTRLPQMTPITGDDDHLDRSVRWVHVSELDDPTPYLRGGELILSAGVHLPRGPMALHGYVARLVDSGITALGFGIAPVYTAVPKRLIAACQDQGLLLLEVPPSVPFIAISEALASELEARHLHAVEQLNRSQRKIVSAATHPRPLKAIVAVIADQLRAGVVLVDIEHGQRWQAGKAVPTSEDVSRLVEQARPGPGLFSAARHDQDGHVFVQPVHAADRRLVLAISTQEPLTTPEHNVVSVGVAAMALAVSGSAAHAASLFGAAVVTLASGGDLIDLERFVAKAIDAPTGEGWRAIACAPTDLLGEATDRRQWAEQVSVIIGSPLLTQSRTDVVALLPEKSHPQRVADALIQAGNVVALSDVHSWPTVGHALAQARRTLSTALMMRHRPLMAPTEGVELDHILDPATAHGFAQALLTPVLDLPASDVDTLLGTLRTWLVHNGSWDRSSRALGVHRNTVRNRIRRLSRLLDRDLDDVGTRMQLWFSLGWLDSEGSDTPTKFSVTR